MTETFTNKIRVGAITITKAKASNDPDSITSGKSFKIKVRFEDVFGVTGVNGDADADYSSIKYKVYSSNGTVQNNGNPYDMEVSTTAGGDKCGTITLEVNQTATIEGIPVGTKYYIYEDEPKYVAEIKNTNNDSDYTVQAGTIQGTPPKAQTNSADNNNNVTVTNYSSSLTIKEVTDFSTVNSGLLTYTKKAAENDVFKYTVSNEGTASSDVYNSWLLAPTLANNTRSNSDYDTMLTGQPTVADTTHVYFDVSNGNHNDNGVLTPVWNVSGRRIVVWLWDSPTKTSIAKELDLFSTDLYRFDAEDYTTVRFLLLESTDTQTFPKSTYPYGIVVYPTNKSCEYTINNFEKGATYKVRWKQSEGGSWLVYKNTDIETPRQVPVAVTQAYNNYDPDNITAVNGTKPVANTNYEWKDEFASNTPFTNTTGDDGELYLMHGTVFNAAALTENKESSATFYNQFKRDNNSIMTVEQVNTLYSPDRTQTPDALGSTGQRTSNTLGTYYTMSKSLSGSQTVFSPADSNSFVYNDLNANKSVRITETFTNQVNVGSLKITKVLSPNEDDTNNTAKSTAEFKFRIKLTNVFGVGSNNVAGTGYSSIDTKKGTSSLSTGNHINNSTGDYGEFYLKIGETLEIDNIPVGTAYELWEEEQSIGTYYELNEYQQIVSGSPTSLGTGHITGSIDTSGVTKEYQALNKRKTGSLTISKSLIGDDNNTNVDSNTTFYFKVQLTKPTGVTFKLGSNTYYPITCKNSDNTTATYIYNGDYVIQQFPSFEKIKE